MPAPRAMVEYRVSAPRSLLKSSTEVRGVRGQGDVACEIWARMTAPVGYAATMASHHSHTYGPIRPTWALSVLAATDSLTHV